MFLRYIHKTAISFSLISLLSVNVAVAAPKVVASIPPLHSLVSMVMEGVGEPDIILTGNASPHDFSLRPSHGQMLQNADVVFWVGAELETFLKKPLDELAPDALAKPLIDTAGLVLLDRRRAEDFKISTKGDDHDHDNHGAEDKHEDHAGHKDHEDHDDHAEHDKDKDHAHEDHGHEHVGTHDPHIWLDPKNSVVLINEIAAQLAQADPENAETYKANARSATMQFQALNDDVKSLITSQMIGNFVVFHDGFQYFEKAYGLQASGLFVINPEVSPSAAQVASLRDLLADGGANCIFIEPQFDKSVAEAIANDTGAKVILADPLGAQLELGSTHYTRLIENIVDSFQECAK